MDTTLSFDGHGPDDARRLLPHLLSSLARQLQRHLTLPAPTGASQDPIAPAAALQLAAYRSACPDWQRLITERLRCCQLHLDTLRETLHALLPGTTFSATRYQRGHYAATADAETTRDALHGLLSTDLHLARAALHCHHRGHHAPDRLLQALIQFALSDSHSPHARQERQHRHECQWPDGYDLAAHHTYEPHHDPEPPTTRPDTLSDLHDALLPLFQQHTQPHLRPHAPHALELYLRGMLQAAHTHTDLTSGWGRLRLPRGFITDTLRPTLNIGEKHESALRRALERALHDLRDQH